MKKIKSTKASFCLFLFIFSYVVEAKNKDMEFSLTEPACNGNASYCLPFVDAIGEITADTPKRFEQFIRKNKNEEFNREIFFDSNGGNLKAAIELAYLIKANEFSTSITHKCYSACAYAFIGGKRREFNKKARLGVHRFYAEKNLGDDNTQHVTAILSNFLDTMEVNRKMLDIASLTDNKTITTISRQKAIELNIINTVPKYSNWRLEVDEDSSVYTCSISTLESKKAMGYLCFFYNENIEELTGKFLYRINQNLRTNKELREIYRLHSDTEISFVLNNDYMDLKHKGWKFEKENAFSTEFIVPSKLTLKLIREKEFEITGNFSNYAKDIEPKMQFSTKEFQDNLMAVLK